MNLRIFETYNEMKAYIGEQCPSDTLFYSKDGHTMFSTNNIEGNYDVYESHQESLELEETATEFPDWIEGKFFEKITINRSINAGRYAPLCLPFDMSTEEVYENFGEDVYLFKINNFTVKEEQGGLTFEQSGNEVNEYKKGTVLLIKTTKAITEINVRNKIIDSTEPTMTIEHSDYVLEFIGNFTKITVPLSTEEYTTFIWNNNLIYRVNSTITNKGYRGYYKLTAISSEE